MVQPLKKRYTALRVIAILYKIFGMLLALLTLLLVAASFAGGAATFLNRAESQFAFFGPLIGIVGLIYGGLLALFFYAAGGGIYLLLALEENTRLTTNEWC